MTVTTTLDRQYFDGDGSNKVFPFNFRFFTNDQIYVSLIAPDGTITPQNLTTNYTLSGALQAGGGTVTMIVAPPLTVPATRVFVQRILPQVQPTSIRNQGKFYPEIHEDAFDRLTMLIQQALAGLSNALQLTFSKTGWNFLGYKGINVGAPTQLTDAATKGYVDSSSQGNNAYTDGQILRTVRGGAGEVLTQLPPAASRANMIMGFDSLGNPIGVLPASGSALELALLLANKSDQFKGSGMIGYRGRTLYERLSDFVSITDYYESADGGDWSLAYDRAILASPRVKFPYRSDVRYEFRRTRSFADNCILLGENGVVIYSPEAIDASGSSMIRLFNTTGGKNLTAINLKFDGGVREVQTAKSFVRPVEFKNSSNIVLIGCEVVNNPDWSLSFEWCDSVIVRDYTQRSYVYADDSTTRAMSGGRDGLHFMDCKNVYADDLDIESGDDCVGITSRDTGCANINIGNIHGSSVIASPVIYNEEQVSGSYVAKPMVGLHIKGVRVKSGATVRNVVRVVKYNPLSIIKDVTVSDVTGQSSNHGVHLSGVDEGSLNEINTVSTGQHGVYLSQCSSITGSARGKSLLARFDGVQLSDCKNMKMDILSTGSANYGMHLLAVVDSVITPLVNDCGGVAFSSNSGGNGRMVNCIGVEIPNGILSGAIDTSYYGLQEAGNTDCRVGAGVKIRGFINRQGARNPTSVFQEPTVAVRFSESGGVLTVSTALGCSVVLVSLGVYKIVFNTAMRSTNFNYQAFASSVGAVRNIKQVSAALVGEVTISTVDAAGAVAASIVSFLAFDS